MQRDLSNHLQNGVSREWCSVPIAAQYRYCLTSVLRLFHFVLQRNSARNITLKSCVNKAYINTLTPEFANRHPIEIIEITGMT